MMVESECIKEYFMLGFNFGPNHKCVWAGIILVKWEARLALVRFIGSLDHKMKNWDTCSVWFWTGPDKSRYFFGFVRFGLSVSLVLSEPLTPLGMLDGRI